MHADPPVSRHKTFYRLLFGATFIAYVLLLLKISILPLSFWTYISGVPFTAEADYLIASNAFKAGAGAFLQYFGLLYIYNVLTMIAIAAMLLRRFAAVLSLCSWGIVENSMIPAMAAVMLFASFYVGPFSTEILTHPNPKMSGAPIWFIGFFSGLMWTAILSVSLVGLFEPRITHKMKGPVI